MRTGTLNHRLKFGARRRKSILVVRIRCQLIPLHYLLKSGVSDPFLSARLHVSDSRRNVVRVIQSFGGLWAAFTCQRLQLWLQGFELLNGSVIVVLFELVKLAFQLRQPSLFRLVDLGQRGGVTAVLLELDGGAACGRIVAFLHALPDLV